MSKTFDSAARLAARDPRVIAELDGEQRTDAPDEAEIDRRIIARLLDDVDRLSAALAEAEARPTLADLRAAVAAEREVCAVIVDKWGREWHAERSFVLTGIADAIRARGTV